jgi:hypothetical protein
MVAIPLKEGMSAKEFRQAAWRCRDLICGEERRFGVSVSEDTIARMLHALGFSHITAGPKYSQQKRGGAIAGLKKIQSKLEKALQGVSRKVSIEIWFQDEMRIGRKNGCGRSVVRVPVSPSINVTKAPTCLALSVVHGIRA